MRVLGQTEPPVGIQSFEDVVKRNCIRADKSMFIKAIVESNTRGYLILRPRRFGKSLNLSMLKEFLDVNANPDLFYGTLISDCTDFVRDHQNKYPVINLCLSSCKAAKSEVDLLRLFNNTFSKVYEEKSYICSGLTVNEKDKFDKISNEKGDAVDISLALDNLVTWLHKHHNKTVFILIDEYDTILQNAHKKGFLHAATELYGAILENGSKNNITSPRTVLFGIHSTSLGLMESSTNHLVICSLLSYQFNNCFGFTEKETREIIQRSGTSVSIEDMLHFYSGHMCGKVTVLNPWSVTLCIKEKIVKPYWPATANKNIIKNKILRCDPAIQGHLSHLTRNGTIKVKLPKDLNNFTFETLEKSNSYFWLDLLFTGYVKIQDNDVKMQNDEQTKLKLPNEEIRLHLACLLEEEIPMPRPFINSLNYDNYNLQTFYTELSKFLGHSTTCMNFNVRSIENDYRKFFTGVLFFLTETYEIHTEVGTSSGRLDHCAIPHDRSKAAVVFELKANVKEENKLYDRAVDGAKQLILHHYHDYCAKFNILKAWLVSLSFFQKEIAMIYSNTAVNVNDDATNVRWKYISRSACEDDIHIQL